MSGGIASATATSRIKTATSRIKPDSQTTISSPENENATRNGNALRAAAPMTQPRAGGSDEHAPFAVTASPYDPDMQITEFGFRCEWCDSDFIRPHERGRRPLYCKRTCRQRAFEERRRGAFALGLPKAAVFERLHPDPKHYQAGTGGAYKEVVHALRPDGCADNIGFRPALCWSRVKPSNRDFYIGFPLSCRRNCATCTRVAGQFPHERRINPLSDIGTATALIGMLRAARRAPEPVLREQVDQMLSVFGAPAGAAFTSSAA